MRLTEHRLLHPNRLFRCGSIFLLCFSLLIVNVAAYTFSTINPPYDDPLSVSVYISPSMPHIDDVEDAYDNWDYLTPVETYRSYNVNYTEAYFVYSDISTGAYAGTSPIGSSDWKQVVCRPSWVNSLDSDDRQEVIAHEMGHCWGLGHGSNTSLMRERGFNGSANPTTDDVAGISARYGGT